MCEITQFRIVGKLALEISNHELNYFTSGINRKVASGSYLVLSLEIMTSRL